MDGRFDVIIVGGRPAGSALATRLGLAGLRVLILDRAHFPSRPPVSAPFVLPHTLAELDEIGADEACYAADTPQLRRFVLEFAGYFRACFRFYEPIAGRTHFYAVDRARLDGCLWRKLGEIESVTAIEGCKVTGLLRDEDGRVVGVRGGEREFRARCVVGADGRHSLVAREVEAPVIASRDDLDTTLYYAHWEGVLPYDDDELPAQIHTSCDGFSFVFMPSADGQTMVVAQGRADLYQQRLAAASPDVVYTDLLRERPRVWRRLVEARQQGSLSGIKSMGNLFRKAQGPGWALVGDAYHQKDSLDAQGIYDALLGAKLLAEALIDARDADADGLDRALERYGERIHAALWPMFQATMERVEREIYQVPPPIAARTAMRWILTHEQYGRRFAAQLTRRIDPSQFFVPSLLLRCAGSGAVARLGARLRGGVDPTDPLPLPRG
ncbi:MAG: NAD(P)/FAD-dependent oxidoreductase [Myxococcales bacterium]|nr:NAD(P)/FAD-dependent oxidoreductase [Myxococcales bacterium]